MALYLSQFKYASIDDEEQFLNYIRRNCYDTFYPFGILTKNQLRVVDFEPITIFYGGNGSGKSTALNIIAEKLGLERDTLYNRSSFYEDYLNFCDYKAEQKIPTHSRIVTSDDVFDFMLNLRCLNQQIDVKREELFEEYLDDKYSHFQMKSLDDYEELKKRRFARRNTQSHYVREKLMGNVREHSNGESAFLYFADKIKEDALYLLDEPENSLSPQKQLELKQFISDSARFWNCQFVISTHSPFILSLKGAKIYDFDESPVDVKKWTELENVQVYQRFFRDHANEFR